MMDFGFVWDETKYEKVKRKHHIMFHEVVAAFEDSDGYETADPSGQYDRQAWVGKTPTGRILVIIYSEEELPLYRLITAFEAEGEWLNEYQRR